MNTGTQNFNIETEANLIFFLHDRLEPALRNADKFNSSGDIVSVYSSLELVESFLWLHLGVSVGCFPQALSRRVAYEYFVPMVRAYETILETKQTDTWIAQPMRSVLSEEFGGNAALLPVSEQPRRLSEFEMSIESSVIFQNAFPLANRFAQDEQCTKLVAAISLVSGEKMWRKIAEKRPEDFPLDNGQSVHQPDEDIGWSYQGFFKTVEYMKAIPQLQADTLGTLETLLQRGRVASRDRTLREDTIRKFFEQMKQVQQWRLNFGYPTPRERFLQIVRNVSESLAKFTSSDEPPDKAVRGFETEISDLLHYWGAPYSQVASA